MDINKKNGAYALFFVFLIVVYCIYRQGIGGSLYYDDYRPLSALASLDDQYAIWAYVFGEVSGPLGRPISMLSFLLNRDDWPNKIENILYFNVLLHCINAVLVFLLCRLLIKLNRSSAENPEWSALLASALWMLSPLLISTSLIAVQRMAGLSAFFVLLGLVFYLSCFFCFTAQPRLRLVMQALCIGLFTLLAMFSKENGILLPVFALVVEVTLLRRNESARKFYAIRKAIFFMCFTIIIGYILSRVVTAEKDYLHRSYTLAERLITQPVVLFDYLRLAFLPDMFSYRPFHDNYSHFTSVAQWQVIVAGLSLAVFLILAVLLVNKFSLFSFSVFWFVAAHLLESTTVSLELFFEHRNYIALIGPCLVIAMGLSHIPERYRNLRNIIVSAYLCLLAFSSYQVASIWGNQPLAGKVWFENAKGSARAAEHYAIQLLEDEQPEKAYLVLQEQAENCPKCIGSQIQAMQLACRFDDQVKVAIYYEQAMHLSTQVRNLGSAPSSLAAIIRDVNNGACTQVDLDKLKSLNLAVLPDKEGSVRLAILINLHQIARAQGDEVASLSYLQQAWEVENNRVIGQILVSNFIELNRLDEAQAFIDNDMCEALPRLRPLREKELEKCRLAAHWVAEALEERKGML